MERITTQMIAQRTLVDLTQSYDRMSNTQEQLSSGKKINLRPMTRTAPATRWS